MHTCNFWPAVFLTWVFRNTIFCHIVLQESHSSGCVNEQVCIAEKWRFFFTHCIDYRHQGSSSWTSELPTLQELEQKKPRNTDSKKGLLVALVGSPVGLSKLPSKEIDKIRLLKLPTRMKACCALFCPLNHLYHVEGSR